MAHAGEVVAEPGRFIPSDGGRANREGANCAMTFVGFCRNIGISAKISAVVGTRRVRTTAFFDDNEGGTLALKVRSKGGHRTWNVSLRERLSAPRGSLVPPPTMRNFAAIGRIERAETLFAELKAIARWDKDYWRFRNNELRETAAFLSRCRRRVEILSELVAIVSAMYCEKSDPIGRSLTGKCRRRSFLRMF